MGRRVRIGESAVEVSLELMVSSPDKKWNFTDFTSFVVMRETGVGSSFRRDPNFAEAGFQIFPHDRAFASRMG
ncbi:MAG: hypothetical protein WCA77_08630 [Thermoplasmata archaeon]